MTSSVVHQKPDSPASESDPLPGATSGQKSLSSAIALSVVLHTLVLILASFTIRGCQQGIPGDPGGEVYREIGLFVVEGSDPRPEAEGQDQSNADGQQSTDVQESVSNPEQQQPVADVIPDEAPSLQSLIGESTASTENNSSTLDLTMPSVIGSGAAISGLPPRNSSANPTAAATSAGGDSAAGAVHPGPGRTSFMNIVDGGSSFVYLIDASSSMQIGNRLELAKRQLKASLRLLQPNQQFHVIFYNEQPWPLLLRPNDDVLMTSATLTNVELACRKADSQMPFQGTHHLPALLAALQQKPNVLYFLTDGDQPQLYPQEMQLVLGNARGTTIHVIEFAEEGLRNPAANWLQQLAQKTGGQYRRYTVSD
ncbi:MAG: hypothetical protein KDA85_05570 [Planctomycetaceae bacterium]|nr:hypothetical protein [Planctomycetaceae bacterium]